MQRVADQRIAVQVFCKQPLAKRDALGLAHGVKAVRLPDGFGRFYDERGGICVELVGMRLKPAVLGLFKGKGERIKGLAGAKPDKPA